MPPRFPCCRARISSGEIQTAESMCGSRSSKLAIRVEYAPEGACLRVGSASTWVSEATTLGGLEVYAAHLNADAKPDAVIIFWGSGCGFASVRCSVVLALSSQSTFAFWQLDSMGFGPASMLRLADRPRSHRGCHDRRGTQLEPPRPPLRVDTDRSRRLRRHRQHPVRSDSLTETGPVRIRPRRIGRSGKRVSAPEGRLPFRALEPAARRDSGPMASPRGGDRTWPVPSRDFRLVMTTAQFGQRLAVAVVQSIKHRSSRRGSALKTSSSLATPQLHAGIHLHVDPTIAQRLGDPCARNRFLRCPFHGQRHRVGMVRCDAGSEPRPCLTPPSDRQPRCRMMTSRRPHGARPALRRGETVGSLR